MSEKLNPRQATKLKTCVVVLCMIRDEIWNSNSDRVELSKIEDSFIAESGASENAFEGYLWVLELRKDITRFKEKNVEYLKLNPEKDEDNFEAINTRISLKRA